MHIGLHLHMLYSYMAHLTIDSLGDMFSSANHIMDWLGKVALRVAHEVSQEGRGGGNRLSYAYVKSIL